MSVLGVLEAINNMDDPLDYMEFLSKAPEYVSFEEYQELVKDRGEAFMILPLPKVAQEASNEPVFPRPCGGCGGGRVR